MKLLSMDVILIASYVSMGICIEGALGIHVPDTNGLGGIYYVNFITRTVRGDVNLALHVFE